MGARRRASRRYRGRPRKCWRDDLDAFMQNWLEKAMGDLCPAVGQSRLQKKIEFTKFLRVLTSVIINYPYVHFSPICSEQCVEGQSGQNGVVV